MKIITALITITLLAGCSSDNSKIKAVTDSIEYCESKGGSIATLDLHFGSWSKHVSIKCRWAAGEQP